MKEEKKEKGEKGSNQFILLDPRGKQSVKSTICARAHRTQRPRRPQRARPHRQPVAPRQPPHVRHPARPCRLLPIPAHTTTTAAAAWSVGMLSVVPASASTGSRASTALALTVRVAPIPTGACAPARRHDRLQRPAKHTCIKTRSQYHDTPNQHTQKVLNR